MTTYEVISVVFQSNLGFNWIDYSDHNDCRK